jgi:hypothetical protein
MWKKSERNTRLFSSSDNARLSSAASAMAAFIPSKRSIRRRVLVPLFCCPPKLLYHGGKKIKNKQNKIDGFFIHLLFCVCLMYDDDTKSAANSIFPFELPNDDRYRCDCNE